MIDEPFLTFAVREVRISAGKYTVIGDFAFVDFIRDQQKRPHLRFFWFSTRDKPVEFNLPPALLHGRRFDQVSPYDVEQSFAKMMEETPFAVIPEAPVAIPGLEKMPPKKRRKAIDAAKKARSKRINDAFQGQQ